MKEDAFEGVGKEDAFGGGWEETLVWLTSVFCCTKFALFLSVPVFGNLGRN